MKTLIFIVAVALFSLFTLPYTASAFCNDEYDNRYPLTLSNSQSVPFLVNDTNGVDLGDGIQYIWCAAEANYLCYDNSTSYDCFNGDTKVGMKVDEGNGTDYGNVDPNIVTWFTFNDTSDDSPYGHDLSVAGGDPARTDGCVVGGCYDFDGDDYFSLSTYNPWSDAYTFMIWFYADSDHAASYGTFMNKQKAGAGHDGGDFSFFYDNIVGGTQETAFSSIRDTALADWRATQDSDANIGKGTWQFLVWEWDKDVDSGKSHIYTNATEVGGYSTQETKSTVLETNSNPMAIGRHSQAASYWFKGDIDNFMLFNVSLNTTQISAMYNNTYSSITYSTLGVSEKSDGITIDSPTNTTYYTSSIWLNWTNSSDYDTVFYSLNGAANVTITGNTLISPVVGSNSLVLYMNDSVPNLYNDSVSFTYEPTVDIEFESPANASYQSPPSVDFVWNYTSGISCNTSLYSIDGEDNVSTSCDNFSVTITSLSIGLHNITLFVNNTNNYADSALLWFNVENSIVNCSVAGAIESVKFYFYDEESLEAMNGSAEYAITDVDSSYVWNLSVNNVTNFSICVLDEPRTVDMILLYNYNGYEQRTYYFYHANLTSTLQTINLYQITTGNGDKIEINTRDSNDNDVSDVYVNIERYYPSEDSYRTVMIGRSDSTGKFISYLKLDDVFYKFTLSQLGTAVNTYSAMTITDTADDPETMILYIGSLETQFFDMLQGIGSSCYFNETTNNTVCSVTDPSGFATTATLRLQRLGLASVTDVCTDSGSGSSFTLTCNTGGEPGDYKYSLVITPSPNPKYMAFQDSFYLPSGNNVYGTTGLMITLLIVIAVGGVAIYVHHILGIVVGVVFGIVSFSGIITLPHVTLVSMVFIGVMIMIGSRGR